MKAKRSTFHPGEIEVQRRAGVRDEADEVGAIIGGRIPPAFVPLLAGLRIEARPTPGDPLGDNLAGRPDLGLIAFDPATRRRLRFNGKAVPGDGGFTLDVEQGTTCSTPSGT